MIRSFADVATRDFWNTGKSRRLPSTLLSAARRRLQVFDAATRLGDLRMPPGNRLHALSGDREGQHAISVNDQYRICFVWREGDAFEVEITDYH